MNERFVTWFVMSIGLLGLLACGGDGGGDALDAGPDDAGTDVVEDSAPGDVCVDCEPTRYFGNMPFVFDPPVARIKPEHIGEDSNLLALHIHFFKVPWQALIQNEPFPDSWLAQLEETEALIEQLDVPVYVALTPMDDHTTLIADAAAPDDPIGTACEDLTARPDWDDIRPAYLEYVEYIVDRFQPKFLALAVEIDSYFRDPGCAPHWPVLVDWLNDVYADQKTKRPELTIFSSFQIDQMWEANAADAACVGYSTECLDRNLALVADLDNDAFAISTYPLIAYQTNGGTLPEDYLSIFADRTGLPLVIAETGWPRYTISIDDPADETRCIDIAPSSEELQQMWMERLLGEVAEENIELVVWWSNHDVMPPEVASSCRCTEPTAWCDLLNLIGPIPDLGLRAFGSIGLRDYSGRARSFQPLWRNAARP